MESDVWVDKRMEKVWRLAGSVQNELAEACVMKEMKERNTAGFPMESFFDRIHEASFCAEKLAGELRRLALEHCENRDERRSYERELIETHGIYVSYDNGIVSARLPFLLPHRKHPYTDYLYQPFLMALEDWCRSRLEEGFEIPVFRRATVCFVHEYDKEGPSVRIRDHDNIEEKQAVDALGMFFLVSDGGLSLDTYHTTVLGTENRTWLFLMDQERFASWISSHEPWKLVSKNEGCAGREKSTG